MKRLYVWEWIMILISAGSYFSSLFYGLSQENAVVITFLFTLAITVVALLSTESIVVAMTAFSATGFAAPTIFWDLPAPIIIGLSILLLVGAIYISIIYLIDSRDEIDYRKFFGSLVFEFSVVFLVLKYGHLLWNYWQKF